MSEQDRIQSWNDAVEACGKAAWEEVERMEREAGNGMPSPCRSVIRAIGRLVKAGDERRVLHGISVDDFPTHQHRGGIDE